MAETSEFVPFRFKVSLHRSDSNELLCAGYFSEVTGFEVSMEPKVIKEGGHNWGEHQRSGPVKFAPMTLKRGVTSINDLWAWFDITTRQHQYGQRLHGEITVLGNPSPQENPVMVWKLTGVLPVKFKGPDLNATANQVAIEEVQLVHEGLELQRPPGANG